MHKDLWKTLTLISDAELKDEPPGDTEDRRDGVQRAGAGHGARQPGADDEHEGGGGSGPDDDERRDGGMCQGLMKKAKIGSDVLDDVDGLDAEGAQDHVDGVAGDSQILANKLKKVSKWRGRPRLARRDSLAQTSMLNFALKNSGEGGISAASGSSGVKRHIGE